LTFAQNRSSFQAVRAIAYLRFSADDQAKGNSIARQTANTERYCQRIGLERVETLVDDGYSAFKGHQISKGALGRFLTLADKGKYKGYALVVEQMDRLSRQGIIETSDLLRRILKAGLEVHVTQPNRVIRSLDDVTTAILNVMESYAAQEYSRKLRERVGCAWAAKKRNGANGISITNKLPGWLEGRSGEPIRVNEEKAKVVRQIFEWTVNGMGKRLVTRRLNEQKVPTFGGGKKHSEHWVHSYIQKILTNRAVLGDYQPRKGRKPDGEPRINFYPPVVTLELFQRVQQAMASRRIVTPNGVTGKHPGRTGKVSNLFDGLITDRTMQMPMHYSDKGKRSRPQLVTNCKDINGARPNTINYARFEKMFLRFLDDLDWTTILDITESDELRRQEEIIVSLNLDITRGESEAVKIVDLLVDTPSKTLKDRLLKVEARIEKDKADKDAAEKRLAELKRRHNELLDKSLIYSKLAKAHDFETRARLRQEIRRKVHRIELSFEPMVFDRAFLEQVLKGPIPAELLEPKPHNRADIFFVNGVERGFSFNPDSESYILINPEMGDYQVQAPENAASSSVLFH
jgi:DNA invertase Pin-like site-specific DNA recombinase